MSFLKRLFGGSPEDQFARKMTAALRQAGISGPIRYDRGRFELAIEAGVSARLALNNAYEEYQAAVGEDREAVIARYVRLATRLGEDPVPESFEQARPHLRPLIRDQFRCEALRLRMILEDSPERQFSHRVVAEHLALMLAYDLPEQIRTLTEDPQDLWGVSFEEAIAIARDNLAATGVGFSSLGAGVYVANAEDNYDASRLVLTEVIQQLAVTGQHVAMVPHRDALIITGSEDAEGLGLMASLAEEPLRDSRAITGYAFVLESDEWAPFAPPLGHPAYEAFRMLAVGSLVGDYDEQAQALEAIHQKTGQGVFVAGCKALRSTETGEIRTSSVWSQGVDTLLPQTDQVIFVTGGLGRQKALGAAPWERVYAACCELMEPQDLYPPRFRVRDFPSEAQLEALSLE